MKHYASRAALIALVGTAAVAHAQPSDEELARIWQAVADSHVAGPAQVTLRNQATLDLPDAAVFVPRPAADQLMNAWGNLIGDEFVGLVLPTADGEDWFVTVDYIDSGYIADDDARGWDVDELLTSLQEGTRASNQWREEQGFAPIEVTGWIQQPRYDAVQHQLVWSAGVRNVGEPSSSDDGVNYNTYVLGRDGYLSMNLVTSVHAVADDKAAVEGLLAATRFNAGRSYADFDSSTDRVAAYGLAALVGGVAAKKLGLLAVAAAFLVKGWKVVLIGVVALGAVGRKVLGRKSV